MSEFELAYVHGGFDPNAMVAQFGNAVLQANAQLQLTEEAATVVKVESTGTGSDGEDSIRLPAFNSDIGALENGHRGQ